MKKVMALGSVIMLLALTVVSALANYTSISGVVHDSKTNSPWTYGGDVKVYNCGDASQTALVPTVIIAVDGTFSLGSLVDTGIFRPLCVEFDYTSSTSPNGKPGNKIFFIYDDATKSGNHDMGIIYTDTGPTAVTMSEFSSSSNGINLAAVGMLSLLLVGGTFIVLRRRDNA